MYAVYVPYVRDIRPSITVCRPTKGFAIITCHRCLLLLETLSPLSGGPGRSVVCRIITSRIHITSGVAARN